MLNIIKSKIKNSYKNLVVNTKDKIIRHKEFTPAVRN
jgi:hypothetical protein